MTPHQQFHHASQVADELAQYLARTTRTVRPRVVARSAANEPAYCRAALFHVTVRHPTLHRTLTVQATDSCAASLDVYDRDWCPIDAHIFSQPALAN